MGTRRTLGIVVVAVTLFASSGLARAQTDDKTERAGVLVLAIGVPTGLVLGFASVGFHATCERLQGLGRAFSALGEGSSSDDCGFTRYMMAMSFGAAGLSVIVGTVLVAVGKRRAVVARESGPIPRLEAGVAPGGGQLTATWTF